MQQSTIKTVKPGDYFKRKADSKAVYIRGAYCKASKAFECTDTTDINKTMFIKGETFVFVGFTY